MIREPVERLHEGRLAAIAAVHFAAAFVLVPLHYATEGLFRSDRSDWIGNDLADDAIRVTTLLIVVGVTHGVALAQLTLVALGMAMLRWHWAIRLVMALFGWGSLLLCWTIPSLLRDPNSWRYSYSELTEYGPLSALIVSLGYLLAVAAFASIARHLRGLSFTFAHSSEPMPDERWQLSILDLLLVTTISAVLVSAALWGGRWWIDAVENLTWRQMANTILIVHIVVATPLIFIAAVHAASGQRPSRWRMAWFLAACIVETLLVLLWISFLHGLELGGLGIFVICLVGTQLLVVVATIRALIAAGGRLVRAKSTNFI